MVDMMIELTDAELDAVAAGDASLVEVENVLNNNTILSNDTHLVDINALNNSNVFVAV